MGFFTIDDVKALDLNALIKLLPGAGMAWVPFSTQGRYVSALLGSQDVLIKNGVNTPLRFAHFVGQGLTETGFFRYAAEDLRYNAAGLRKYFGKYYKTLEEAKADAGNARKIANRVYGGRLGNKEPNDGWTYRGRGFFQITGRANYQKYGKIAEVDLETDPSILEKDFNLSIAVAAAYWKALDLGKYADKNDAAAVSRGVNLGNPDHTTHANHELERKQWTAKTLGLLSEPARVLKPAAAPEPAASQSAAPVAIPEAPSELALGAYGPKVRELQRELLALGYLFTQNEVDSDYGPKTHRAVSAFQHEHSIAPTGIADQATFAAIDAALGHSTAGGFNTMEHARQ